MAKRVSCNILHPQRIRQISESYTLI